MNAVGSNMIRNHRVVLCENGNAMFLKPHLARDPCLPHSDPVLNTGSECGNDGPGELQVEASSRPTWFWVNQRFKLSLRLHPYLCLSVNASISTYIEQTKSRNLKKPFLNRKVALLVYVFV